MERISKIFKAAVLSAAVLLAPLIFNVSSASAATYYTHSLKWGSWTYISEWLRPASFWGNAPSATDHWYENRYTPQGDVGLLPFPDGLYQEVGTFTREGVEFKVFMSCQLWDWGNSYCNPWGGNYIYTDQTTVVNTSPTNPLGTWYEEIAVDFPAGSFNEGLVLHNVNLSMFWNGVSSSVSGPAAPTVSADSIDFGTVDFTGDCSNITRSIEITGTNPGATIHIRFRGDETTLILDGEAKATLDFTWPSELCELGEFEEEIELWENDGTYDGDVTTIVATITLVEPTPPTDPTLPPSTGLILGDNSDVQPSLLIAAVLVVILATTIAVRRHKPARRRR